MFPLLGHRATRPASVVGSAVLRATSRGPRAFERLSRCPAISGTVAGAVRCASSEAAARLRESGTANLASSLGFQVTMSEAKLRGGKPVELTGLAASAPEVKAAILEDFDRTWQRFDLLHDLLAKPEAYFVRHESLRHPPIFYVGHTASFYVNKFVAAGYMAGRVDPILELQTAVGVDEMSWDDLDAKHYMWPSEEEARANPKRAAQFLAQVRAFRSKVRDEVRTLLASQPLQLPIREDSFWWIALMGIEHERIHLETSSVILRQASLDMVRTVPFWAPCPFGRMDTDPEYASRAPKNVMLPVPEGTTRLGRPMRDTNTWGWDNEFAAEAKFVKVPNFHASKYLVSNAEFLAFVRDKGYADRRWWSEEGWNWANGSGVRMPRFWSTVPGAGGDKYALRVLTHEIPMPWDWPAEVNNLEAEAFCRWKTAQDAPDAAGESRPEGTLGPFRLPTEEEYMRMRDLEETDLQNSAHGPAWPEGRAPGNINLEHYASPCPVDRFEHEPSGFCDLLGNVWQHNMSPIDVLPGFKPHPLYEDFTTPTVDGLHARIMGGSFISSGANGATRDNRFGFRRHFYQHAGFRYVRSTYEAQPAKVTPYVTQKPACDALRFHFHKHPLTAAAYPRELARYAAECAARHRAPVDKVLDVGCGPGGCVVEMTKLFPGEVHGADRTAQSMQQTRDLLERGALRFLAFTEGQLCDKEEVTMESLGLAAQQADRLRLHQFPDWAAIDAHKFRDFGLVVAAAPDFWMLPETRAARLAANEYFSGTVADAAVAERLHSIMAPDGVLLTGASDPAVEAQLADALQGRFERLEETQLAAGFQETARKHRLEAMRLTAWRRLAAAAPGASGSGGALAESLGSSLAVAGAQSQAPDYESQSVLAQYLDFHYGPPLAKSTLAALPAPMPSLLDCRNYCVACADEILRVANQIGVPKGSALEVGGGPGRAAFELARAGGYARVVGTDYSDAFVNAARRMLEEQELQWTACDGRGQQHVPLSMLPAGAADKVRFTRLDACGSWDELSAVAAGAGFDLICAFNLIDRVPEPELFLQRAASRLAPGGLLVLSSPYTWLETCTSPDKWLGAYKYGDNDGPTTYEGLRAYLSGRTADGHRKALPVSLSEVAPPVDIPFVIPDGAGRFQRTTAQMSFWRRD